MEEQSMNMYENTQAHNEIAISEPTRNYFYEMSKWTKFLSIVGFVMLGFMVIGAFTAGSFLNSMPFDQFNQIDNGVSPTLFSGFGVFFTIIYLFFAALFFIPNFFLYKFSIRVQSALNKDDRIEFDEAINNHRSFYKFWGIFTIIILGFYALMFTIGLAF